MRAALLLLALPLLALASVNGKCAGTCMTKDQVVKANLTVTCLPYMFTTDSELRCIEDEAIQENNTRLAISLATQSSTPCYSPSCPGAMSAFLCAQAYPKCDKEGYVLPPCRSTCLNARHLCTCTAVAPQDDCLEFDGVGPSATCTGAASTIRMAGCVLAVIIAALLL